MTRWARLPLWAFALAVAVATGCASPGASPVPDRGGVGFATCPTATRDAFERQMGTLQTASIGGGELVTKGGALSCRRLDDGASACDVRGPTKFRVGSGEKAAYFEIEDGRQATVTFVGLVLQCRSSGS